MLSDEEVARWLWFAPLDEDGVHEFFVPYLEAQNEAIGAGTVPPSAVFVVHSPRPENTYLGMGAVVEVEGSPRGFELGFQLPRATWGRGVGSRLAEFLASYAIHVGNAFRIEGSCLEGNVASQQILRGLGLDLEGTRVDYRLKQRKRHTELIFGARVEDLDQARFEQLAKQLGLLDSGS